MRAGETNLGMTDRSSKDYYWIEERGSGSPRSKDLASWTLGGREGGGYPAQEENPFQSRSHHGNNLGTSAQELPRHGRGRCYSRSFKLAKFCT